MIEQLRGTVAALVVILGFILVIGAPVVAGMYVVAKFAAAACRIG